MLIPLWLPQDCHMNCSNCARSSRYFCPTTLYNDGNGVVIFKSICKSVCTSSTKLDAAYRIIDINAKWNAPKSVNAANVVFMKRSPRIRCRHIEYKSKMISVKLVPKQSIT